MVESVTVVSRPSKRMAVINRTGWFHKISHWQFLKLHNCLFFNVLQQKNHGDLTVSGKKLDTMLTSHFMWHCWRLVFSDVFISKQRWVGQCLDCWHYLKSIMHVSHKADITRCHHPESGKVLHLIGCIDYTVQHMQRLAPSITSRPVKSAKFWELLWFL